MGNTSAVAKSVKKQGQNKELYDLVNMKGGGILIEEIKRAKISKDFSTLDKELDKIGKRFLFGNGQGERIKISSLIEYRNKGLKKRGAKNLIKQEVKPNVTDNYWNHEVCWRLKHRGTVGETILHLCFLNSSRAHSELAKRLIHKYPKLIHDIYAGDEYYGENVLHMAIVNEDPAMVKFLLDHGADCRARACGNFFFPDDQKKSRTDNPYHEWIDVCKHTNYEGHVYYGEYPLSFAACLGQEECVRLLIAKDRLNTDGQELTPLPNLQDANGNTVLHMLIIHDKKEMFDLVHSLGADLNIKNNQDLTPLTLAAKLARKDIYEHLLETERKIFWKFGNVTCAGYPLNHIDTISTSGKINVHSALNLIVYGQEQGHLDMIDGVIENLLLEKWKQFIRFKFYRRFIAFILYFLAFAMAFGMRPGRDYCSGGVVNSDLKYCNVNRANNTMDPCYLLKPYRTQDVIRLTLELIVLLSAIGYLFLSMVEIHHQGFKCFFTTLTEAPAKALFLLSCVLVVLMLPGRAACSHEYEDYMAVFAILCTAPYFLFFCRGFHIVGPFVVMIYNMIKGDLFRFVMIYVIFLIGFSQAMFIQFRHLDSVFASPYESIVAMFTMSVGQFEDFYANFDDLEPGFSVLVKLIFMLYMVLVTLLLVNMLIAMMGNTYELIASTEKEWLRQWAKIVLVVEQSVSTSERKEKQKLYSQFRNDEGRDLVIRYHQTEKERDEETRLRAFHKLQQKKKKKKIKIIESNSPKVFTEFELEEGKVNI